METDGQLVSALSCLYQVSSQRHPAEYGNYKDLLGLAGSVILNPAPHCRDVILLALTSCRQCFLHDNVCDSSKEDLQKDFLDSLVELLKSSDERFIITAARDLFLSMQFHTLSQVTEDCEVAAHRYEAHIFDIYQRAVNSGSITGLVTFLDLMGTTTSELLRRDHNVQFTVILNRYVNRILSEWDTLAHLSKSSTLVSSASLNCLAKIIKVGKKTVNINLLKTVEKILTSDFAMAIIDGNDSKMLWQTFWKLCRQILKYDHTRKKDMASKEGLDLSRWMICKFSVKCMGQSIEQFCLAGIGSTPSPKVKAHLLRPAINVTLMALVRLLHSDQQNDKSLDHSVLAWLTDIKTTSCDVFQSTNHCEWFFDVFLEQDDAMSECLLALVDIYIGLGERSNVSLTDISWAKPLELFSSLLSLLSYDHTVVLDWIISPETVFLQYLMSLLHYMISHWHVIVLDIALDEDFIEQSDMDSQQTSLVRITDGFESLMSYDDYETTDEESGSEKSEQSDAQNKSIQQTLKTLRKISYSLQQMVQKDITPFNMTPLITLLNQVCSLS